MKHRYTYMPFTYTQKKRQAHTYVQTHMNTRIRTIDKERKKILLLDDIVVNECLLATH